jgi:hypothetical protein
VSQRPADAGRSRSGETRRAGARRPGPSGGGRAPSAAGPEPGPLPLRHPAHLVLLLVAAITIALIVSTRILDTDLWQHLAVGRAIWTLHHVPTTQLWSWPTYGSPDVNSSWGFETLLWAAWKIAGVVGLDSWRIKTALLAFGISWLTARRLGARGFGAAVVAVLGALIVHRRTQLRPETLAMVLFALQIWVLETRRQGGADRSWLLVPIAWGWINCHISYQLGFAMLAIHLTDGWLEGPTRGAATRRLALWTLAALAISFVNPFGWRALAQPFEFLTHQRQTAMFANIEELRPLDWSRNVRTGLPLAMIGWPILLLWRARTGKVDRVELASAIVFSVLALRVQRFVTFYAIVMTPYLARDLAAFLRGLGWSRRYAVGTRAAVAILACLGLGTLAWSDPHDPIDFGLEPRLTPIAACDFIQTHGVRGRSFHHFFMGGYLLYRFWPDHDRLPFMDVHQSGGAAIQDAYLNALGSGDGWRALRDRERIEWALLWRVQVPGDVSLDVLDADTTFRLVFADDVAALYVRRAGPLAAVADSFGYRTLVCGERSFGSLVQAWQADTSLRRVAHDELARAVASSPYHDWAAHWRDEAAAPARAQPFGR